MKYIQLSDIGEVVEETDAFTKVRITVEGDIDGVDWEGGGFLALPKDQVKDGMISKELVDAEKERIKDEWEETLRASRYLLSYFVDGLPAENSLVLRFNE